MLERFTKKNCKWQTKQNDNIISWSWTSMFNENWIEKGIKRKEDKLMLNAKVMIIILTAGLIKKILLYKMSYFPET